MATYFQLERIIRDPEFQMRVLYACRKAAETLWLDVAATPLQRKWADRVRRNEPINIMAVCAQVVKITAQADLVTETNGVVSSSATDLQLLARINVLVGANDDLIAMGV